MELPYKSKDGFVRRKVIRGFTEIKNIYNVIRDNDINCFICGGYVRYMVSNQPVPVKAGDVDIYSYDKEAFEKLKNILKKEYGLKTRHENEMAITFQRPDDEHHTFFASPPIQLIKPIKEGVIKAVGEMKYILSNFDFTVIRCGLISETEALVDADFEWDEKKMFLRIKNIHCPISSSFRVIKYSGKGYWMNTFGVLKLFLDWDERDESYREKLVDFLQKTEERGLTKTEIDELESLMRVD